MTLFKPISEKKAPIKVKKIFNKIKKERKIKVIPNFWRTIANDPETTTTKDGMYRAKRQGFSDRQLAVLSSDNVTEIDVRNRRKDYGILPTYGLVDTCAGEFEAYTPYYYSSYETEDK